MAYRHKKPPQSGAYRQRRREISDRHLALSEELHSPPLCTQTGKQCLTVEEAIERIARTRRIRGIKLFHYPCKFCGFEHLTNDPHYRGKPNSSPIKGVQ